MKSLHKPVKEGECAVCHELHGGALAKLLKDGVRAAVCRGCHPSPSGAHHQFSVAELKAAGDGSQVEVSGCLHCHLPHASAQRRLLLAPSDRCLPGLPQDTDQSPAAGDQGGGPFSAACRR